MKKDIHPDYHEVVFHDITSGSKVITRSTATSNETITMEDGNTYPVIKLDISGDSHPFYTGQQRIVDTAGRVEKFNQRRTASEKAQKAAKRREKAKA